MNILHRVTWKTMWSNRTRTLVTLPGIVLSAAMFCAVTTLVGSIWDYLYRVEVQHSGDYYLSGDHRTEDQVGAILQDERVSTVIRRKVLGYYNLTPEDYSPGMNTCVIAAGDGAFFRNVPVKLVTGRLPQTSDELLISDYTQAVLEYNGLPSTVGSSLTLTVLSYPPDGEPNEHSDTHTYTIVGVHEDGELYEDLYFSVAYTYEDGRQGEALYQDLFLKTRSPYQALETGKTLNLTPNEGILCFFAVTEDSANLTTVLVIGGVVLGIILFATVLLIRNAFSISVTQRIRDFGLLASIGATRKQLRRSVRFEALLLCALGLPGGILLGLGGVALALDYIGQRLAVMFGWVQADVALYLVPYPLTILAGVLITLLAVLLSAHASARRAAATSPMAAIRQTGFDRIRARNVRASRGAWKRLGAPGALAWKYYRVNRRRHRATVLALGFSVILLFSAFAALGMVSGATRIAVDNFDFACYGDQALLEQIRNHEGVTRSALIRWDYYRSFIELQDYDPDYLAVWKQRHDSGPLPDDWEPYDDVPSIVYFVEDETLRAFLREQGLDAEPYFAQENPAVLLYKPTVSGFEEIGEDVVVHKHTVRPILPDSPILALADWKPLLEAAEEHVGFEHYGLESEKSRTAENEPLVTFHFLEYVLSDDGIADYTGQSITCSYLGKPEGAEEGGGYRFYDYDPETKQIGATVVARMDGGQIVAGCHAGACVEELPFGVEYTRNRDNPDVVALTAFLPMSMYPGMEQSASLNIKAADYEATRAYLAGITDPNFSYTDRVAPQYQDRNTLFLIQVCCFGFVALITMICAANIFNTVSTIISMRRREFGMLRSLGMKWRELRKMVTLEWLRFGAYALLWSLPVGLLISFLLKGNSGFRFPWKATLFAAAGTAVLIFVGVVYALKKVKADTPMEAIRMESI